MLLISDIELSIFGTIGLNAGIRNIRNVWNHGTKLPGHGFICGYCGFTTKVGGATRLRDHLGGIIGK